MLFSSLSTARGNLNESTTLMVIGDRDHPDWNAAGGLIPWGADRGISDEGVGSSKI